MLQLVFVAVICILIIVSYILIKREKINGFKAYFLKIFLFITLIEITVFNINYYRVFFSGTQEMKYNQTDIETYKDKDGNQIVKIDGINSKVKSIFLQLKNVYYKQCIDYEIYYSDETTIERSLGKKTYNQGSIKTKYTVIGLSRKSEIY